MSEGKSVFCVQWSAGWGPESIWPSLSAAVEAAARLQVEWPDETFTIVEYQLGANATPTVHFHEEH